MSEFRKPHGRFGGKKNFGGKPRFSNDRARGPVKLFPATCATCGKPCEVPFRPTGDRPIYCREHFGGNKNGAPVQDRPVAAPFRPAPPTGAPAAPVAPAPDKRIDEIKAQINMINAKLEMILDVMTAPKIEEPASKPESKPELKKKPAPKKKASKKK